MSQSPHAMSLDNVSIVYDNAHRALDQLSCSFEAGSFTALVGPSGCGKSTLLRCLAGLISPVEGKVTASDDIGFVFQEPTLLAWRSVYENVALPMKIAGLAKDLIDQRVTRALEMVGLQSRRTALPRQLSGGMKMRVSLARALAERPQLLLFDEPFAALDELTRVRLDDDLRMIWQQENSTVVFVTHSITEAAYLAERVLVMDENGQLVDDLAMPIRAPEEDFRASPHYHAACQKISAALGHHDGEPS
jgi:NitT/TauT family transport system ATP-binding protein